MNTHVQNRVFSYRQALEGAVLTARDLVERIADKVEQGNNPQEDIAVFSEVVEDIAVLNSNANEAGLDFGDAFKDARRAVSGAEKDISDMDSALKKRWGVNSQEARFAMEQLRTYSGILSRLPLYKKRYEEIHPPAPAES